MNFSAHGCGFLSRGKIPQINAKVKMKKAKKQWKNQKWASKKNPFQCKGLTGGEGEQESRRAVEQEVGIRGGGGGLTW